MARTHLQNGIKVPFTAQEEIDKDAEELAFAQSHPHLTDLTAAKTHKKKELRLQGRRLGAEYIDPHIVKNIDANDLTPVPASVTQFKADMKTNFGLAKTAIENLSTIKEVKEYRMDWPDAPDA